MGQEQNKVEKSDKHVSKETTKMGGEGEGDPDGFIVGRGGIRRGRACIRPPPTPKICRKGKFAPNHANIFYYATPP